jgi:hypothetical protein
LNDFQRVQFGVILHGHELQVELAVPVGLDIIEYFGNSTVRAACDYTGLEVLQ